MIVADQNDLCIGHRLPQLLGIQHTLIIPISLVELAKILPASMRILQADLALHSSQGMKFCRTSPYSKIYRGCHNPARLTSTSRTPYAPMFSSRRTLPNHPPKNLTVATSGASGALFLRHFLLAVAADNRIETVNFIASDSALRVMAEELDLK